TSVEVAWARPEARREEIKDGVRRRLRQESELAVDPEFFAGLASRVPEISGMEVQLRRGRSANELAAFRYDVWLQVGGIGAPVSPREELPWDRIGNVSALREALAEREPDALVVRGIPNARVAESVAVLAWLR